jgi:hypothetical protein
VEGSLWGVCVHMLVSDLLRVEDMQVCGCVSMSVSVSMR